MNNNRIEAIRVQTNTAAIPHCALPLRLEPCQDDHGESTVLMCADDYQVAVIPSALWDPAAPLTHPGDRENAKLILAAVNSFYPARDALKELLDMVSLQRRAAQLRDPDLLWQYNEGIDAAIERATLQLNAMGAEDTDSDE